MAKSSLDESGLRPRKRLGQHFLTDPRILASIADAAEVTAADTVLEIGPGLGHLTRVLAARGGIVVAVEVDADLAAKLRRELNSTPNALVLQGDILAREPIDWIREGAATAGLVPASDFKVVANLPYYITSAILRHLLESAQKPRIAVVMVQREVAARMLAQPPTMNLLAVSVQFFAQVRLIRTIAPGAFYPRPKVESAVVRLDVLARPRVEVADTDRFFEVVRAGFGERRKQLRNSIAHGLGLGPQTAEHILARAHIDPRRRAETLSLEDWGRLYHEWSRRPA